MTQTASTRLRNPLKLSFDERALLRAACLPGASARTAYEDWRPQCDLRRLDDEARAMLPLLSYNLRQLSITDPDEEWLSAWGRRTWYANQRHVEAAADAAAAMRSVGVVPVLLKGAALLAGGQFHSAARSMADVDLLVPRDRLDDVLAVLEVAGWRWADPWPEPISRQIYSGAALTKGRGDNVDLHWAPLWEPGALHDLATRAMPGRLGSAEVLLPSDADHIIVLACHGLGWNLTRVRWIPDLAALLRTADAATWTQVIELSRRDRVSRIVAAACDVVSDVLDVAPPAEVLAELASGPAAVVDRLSARTRGTRRRGRAWLFAVEHGVRRRRYPELGAPPSPMRYLQLVAQVPNRRALLGVNVRHLLNSGGENPVS